MNLTWLSNLGYSTRRQMADIGHGAKLFARLLTTLGTSLKRFGLIRDQIHFLGNYSLVIIAISGLFVGFVLFWGFVLGDFWLIFVYYCCGDFCKIHFYFLSNYNMRKLFLPYKPIESILLQITLINNNSLTLYCELVILYLQV